jgi:capsular exopolysaccharide synthesis family protein
MSQVGAPGWDFVPGAAARPRGWERLQPAEPFGAATGAPAAVGDTDRDRLALDLGEYLQIVWKRRLLVIGILLATLALGTAYVLLKTPTYRAGVTLQIDREASKVLAGGADLQPEELLTGDEFYQTQYGLLKSRFLAERVAAALHLGDNTQDLRFLGWRPRPTRAGETAADIGEMRERDAVTLVQKHITVAPVRGSRLVGIEFDSRDPAFSAQVANALAEAFIAANLDRRFEAASYARDFLQRHLDEERQRLEASERAAVAYAANQQIIALPIPQPNGAAPTAGTESLVAANLSVLNADLAAATSKRLEAEARWRQAQSSSDASLPQVLADPTIQKLVQDRDKTAADYQEKLATYKPGHPTMRQLAAQLADMNRSIDAQVDANKKAIDDQYESASADEHSLQAKVDTLKAQMIDLNNRSIEYNILEREVDTNRTLYEGLLQRYKEVGLAGGVGTNNVSIVDSALPPLKPQSPNAPLDLGLSLVIGIIAGVGAAFLADALDQGIGVPADVEGRLRLPLMGAVPAVARGSTPAQALRDPRSPMSEAVNAVRTALQFSTSDGAPRTLLVTSSRSSEGKTTTAAALADSFARLGGRILLVDGDLRNPSLHRVMGVKNVVGLSKVLAGAARLDQVVQTIGPGRPSVVTCGPLPPNPSELLAGPLLPQFLAEANEAFDLVIIDGPPIVGLSDALSLAAAVVGVLFVVEARKVRRAAARGALRRLATVDARVVGAALCKFNARSAAYGYEYAYHYAYGAAPTK